jgi:hypothetical protein
MHQDLRSLVADNWINESDKSLLPQARTILGEVESFFSLQKKKTNNQVLGQDYSVHIDNYLLLFPKIKLPSGKAARTDKLNCETAFKWFFEHHQYSWETILKATADYVDEYERKNYLYMQTSQYFIRKQQPDKSWGSELANCCAVIEAGGMSQISNHFSDPVV